MMNEGVAVYTNGLRAQGVGDGDEKFIVTRRGGNLS